MSTIGSSSAAVAAATVANKTIAENVSARRFGKPE
jgi:hypothetical protein